MKTMNYNFGARQKGLSIIGVLFALVIGLIVLGVVASQFTKAQASTNAQSEIQNALAVKAAVKEIFKSPSYGSLSSQLLIDSKKAPPKMVSGNNLVNVWTGQVTLAPASVNGGTDNAFTIAEANIPTDECNTLSSAFADNFLKVDIAGTVVKDSTAATPVPYDESAAVAACKPGNVTLTVTSS